MTPSSRLPTVLIAIAAGLLGGIGGAGLFVSGMLPFGEGARDKAMHDYIVGHPDVLPEAMEALHTREASHALDPIRAALEKPYAGAVLGNPSGHRVLVEFLDFACGYCRQSEADVRQVIAANPDLKVVIRQLPILTPESAEAAKWALAAANQGKYANFHRAMYANGRPDKAGIEAAARAAGLDMARAASDAASPEAKAEIDRNLDFARQLGFSGTPSWETGGRILSGAQGVDGLTKALGA